MYVESSFATLPCLDLAAIAEFVLFLLCFSSSLEVMAPNDKRQGQDMYERVRREENDFYSCFINDLEAGKAHWFKIRQKSLDFSNLF